MKNILIAVTIFFAASLHAENRVHGNVDVVLKNDYITPRGLLVTRHGLTTQVLVDLSYDLYKNPATFVNSMSLVGYIWNDLWSRQHHHYVGSWVEMDWGLGLGFQVAEDWHFTAQYLEFVSPPDNFTPEHNIQFTLAYDDSKWNLPVTINPYLRWFWAVSGDSVVVTGRHGKTFDVEIGAVPQYDLHKHNIPLILSAPTWFTVGPANFWNGSKLGLKDRRSNFGVFTTGLRVEYPIASWYVCAGIQYYRIINDSLMQAQTITLHLPSRRHAHRNIYVPSVGLGFRF